jgi:hypothetical protein
MAILQANQTSAVRPGTLADEVVMGNREPCEICKEAEKLRVLSQQLIQTSKELVKCAKASIVHCARLRESARKKNNRVETDSENAR